MRLKFLEKIRLWPERTRKIILWTILIILASIMMFFWIGGLPERLSGPEIGSFIEQLDFPGEEIQKIKDDLNNIETNAPQETQIQEN